MIEEVLETPEKLYDPDPRQEDPFYTLIFTVLSQRTRDEQTWEAARRLFEVYPNAESLAAAEAPDIEKLVRGVGFYRIKARKIMEIAEIIAERGSVPQTLEELLRLPGVGRKTANCVLVYGYGIAAIPVDTHVHRVSNRLGLVSTRNPDETEMALIEIAPKEKWIEINELFIAFGRDICKSISPRCSSCPFSSFCHYALEALR